MKRDSGHLPYPTPTTKMTLWFLSVQASASHLVAESSFSNLQLQREESPLLDAMAQETRNAVTGTVFMSLQLSREKPFLGARRSMTDATSPLTPTTLVPTLELSPPFLQTVPLVSLGPLVAELNVDPLERWMSSLLLETRSLLTTEHPTSKNMRQDFILEGKLPRHWQRHM